MARKSAGHPRGRLPGLEYEGSVEIPVSERWTTDTLIGNIYSSSQLNRQALDSSDAFTQDQNYAIELARRGH